MHKWLRAIIALGAIFTLLTVATPDTTEAQGTFGTNWSASFYANTTFSGTPVVRNYPNGLNFSWAAEPREADGATPVTGIPADNFSVRFQSSQNFTQAGNYTFSGDIDDQIVVRIDGIQVFTQSVPAPFSFTYNVAAGLRTIEIEMVELTSTAVIRFQWQLTTGSPGVPTAPPFGTPPFAFTATPSLPTGPIGQVVNVRGLSLRTGPYLGASFIGVLRPGIGYPVLAQNADEGGGFTWYKIINGEQVGWTSGRYFLVANGTPPTEATVFDQLGDPPSTGVIAEPNAFMNFRRRPSQRSATINDIQIPWGGQVEVLGRTIQGGRNFWFLVRYEGQVGWAYAPYFRVRRGNINAVPIY
jgi:hypothetical protein